MLSIKKNRHPLYSLQNRLRKSHKHLSFLLLLCVCLPLLVLPSWRYWKKKKKEKEKEKKPTNAGEVREVSSIPGWGRPMEESKATHSSILFWRTTWTEETGRLLTVHGVTKSQTWIKWFSTHTHKKPIHYLEFVNSFRSCLFQYFKRL